MGSNYALAGLLIVWILFLSRVPPAQSSGGFGQENKPVNVTKMAEGSFMRGMLNMTGFVDVKILKFRPKNTTAAENMRHDYNNTPCFNIKTSTPNQTSDAKVKILIFRPKNITAEESMRHYYNNTTSFKTKPNTPNKTSDVKVKILRFRPKNTTAAENMRHDYNNTPCFNIKTSTPNQTSDAKVKILIFRPKNITAEESMRHDYNNTPSFKIKTSTHNMTITNPNFMWSLLNPNSSESTVNFSRTPEFQDEKLYQNLKISAYKARKAKLVLRPNNHRIRPISAGQPTHIVAKLFNPVQPSLFLFFVFFYFL